MRRRAALRSPTRETGANPIKKKSNQNEEEEEEEEEEKEEMKDRKNAPIKAAPMEAAPMEAAPMEAAAAENCELIALLWQDSVKLAWKWNLKSQSYDSTNQSHS